MCASLRNLQFPFCCLILHSECSVASCECLFDSRPVPLISEQWSVDGRRWHWRGGCRWQKKRCLSFSLSNAWYFIVILGHDEVIYSVTIQDFPRVTSNHLWPVHVCVHLLCTFVLLVRFLIGGRWKCASPAWHSSAPKHLKWEQECICSIHARVPCTKAYVLTLNLRCFSLLVAIVTSLCFFLL